MLLTKLGRPPAPAAANLLRAEGALAPPATGGNGRDRYGRAPPSGQARRRGAMAGWREMPRNSRRAVGPSSGRTAGWHGARLPLSLPEPTGLGKGPAAPAPGRVASLSVPKDQPAPLDVPADCCCGAVAASRYWHGRTAFARSVKVGTDRRMSRPGDTLLT